MCLTLNTIKPKSRTKNKNVAYPNGATPHRLIGNESNISSIFEAFLKWAPCRFSREGSLQSPSAHCGLAYCGEFGKRTAKNILISEIVRLWELALTPKNQLIKFWYYIGIYITRPASRIQSVITKAIFLNYRIEIIQNEAEFPTILVAFEDCLLITYFIDDLPICFSDN